MRNIELKSRKLLRKVFNGISLTAVAFVFQACYGPGLDPYYDVKLTGTVTSKVTKLPIRGIKVAVNEGLNFVLTDENGKFDFYASVSEVDHSTGSESDKLNIYFLDIDGVANGSFEDKTIVIEPARKNEVKINVEMEEKQ